MGSRVILGIAVIFAFFFGINPAFAQTSPDALDRLLVQRVNQGLARSKSPHGEPHQTELSGDEMATAPAPAALSSAPGPSSRRTLTALGPTGVTLAHQRSRHRVAPATSSAAASRPRWTSSGTTRGRRPPNAPGVSRKPRAPPVRRIGAAFEVRLPG